MKNNKLTPEEKKVIVQKGTEKPFSGKYYDHYKQGIYTCKRCDAKLFRSDDKFDSGCGWPSFDDEIENAIKRLPDADGIRTEIQCANCGAHLGHVFEGEQLTEKNLRHCVNSISLDFIPQEKAQAIFAAGCFWGVEYLFNQLEGVIKTEVGYIGGKTENPSYQEVCNTNSGHAEAVKVVYDPEKISYDKLVKYFFEIHDFEQFNRQGPDIGEQYRSAIFFEDEQQKQTAEKYIQILTKMGYEVETVLEPSQTFWKAEKYHQDYYEKNERQPYCHIHKNIFPE